MTGRGSRVGRVSHAGLVPAVLALFLVVSGWFYAGCGRDSAEVQTAKTEVMASASEPAAPAPAVAPQASPSASVPAAIAGAPLSGWVGGDQARAQVEELHGKILGHGMDEAWVARYGSDQALLWVTRAARSEDARDLYARMVDRIAVGDSPFTAQRPIDTPGVEGYSLEGLGQQHYYFLVGGDLYWLAIDAELASAGLEELVAKARTTAEVE